MVSDILNSVSSLADSSGSLVGKASVLSFVLLFFLAVQCLIVFGGRKLSPARVTATIKIALLGFLVLMVDALVALPPPYESVPGNALSLIAMLCAANLIGYLVVDVYLYFSMGRHVPSNIRDLTAIVIYLLFAVAALRFVFKIDLASILTTTTVLTAAVAFAMQTTLANIASSFYVQGDDNLRMNSWISIPDSNITGEIVNVGLRYTTLRTLDNNRILVPNALITQNVVRTLGGNNAEEKTAEHLKVGLSYEMPPERAIGMLHRILLEEKHVVKAPGPSVVVSNFLDSSVEYDLKYFLDSYSFSTQTRGSILNKTWYAVLREGYGIPFPHREVITKTAQEPFGKERASLADALSRVEILGSLAPAEIQGLADRVHIRVFGPGETVVRQGDDGDSLFIVRGGTLSVLIGGAQVGTLREGDVFGEFSLLTGEKRSASVAAATEARLVEIRKDDLGPVIRENPRLLESLSAILAARQAANLERMKSAQEEKAGTGKEAFLKKLKAFFNLSAD